MYHNIKKPQAFFTQRYVVTAVTYFEQQQKKMLIIIWHVCVSSTFCWNNKLKECDTYVPCLLCCTDVLLRLCFTFPHWPHILAHNSRKTAFTEWDIAKERLENHPCWSASRLQRTECWSSAHFDLVWVHRSVLTDARSYSMASRKIQNYAID